MVLGYEGPLDYVLPIGRNKTKKLYPPGVDNPVRLHISESNMIREALEVMEVKSKHLYEQFLTEAHASKGVTTMLVVTRHLRLAKRMYGFFSQGKTKMPSTKALRNTYIPFHLSDSVLMNWNISGIRKSVQST